MPITNTVHTDRTRHCVYGVHLRASTDVFDAPLSVRGRRNVCVNLSVVLQPVDIETSSGRFSLIAVGTRVRPLNEWKGWERAF